MKIKTGDTVMVISGQYAGTKGKVLRVLPEKQRVVVEKVALRKKHIKKTRERAGDRIEIEAPIHVSNVMIVCPEKKKPTRVRYERDEEGKKYRVSVKSGKKVETPFVKS